MTENKKKLTNKKKLDRAYRRMATDREREIDAQEWSDALINDLDMEEKIEKMVKDFSQIGTPAKSEIRKRIIAYGHQMKQTGRTEEKFLWWCSIDIDEWLPLTTRAKKRLLQSVNPKQKGNYKSLNEIKKKFNL